MKNKQRPELLSFDPWTNATGISTIMYSFLFTCPATGWMITSIFSVFFLQQYSLFLFFYLFSKPNSAPQLFHYKNQFSRKPRKMHFRCNRNRQVFSIPAVCGSGRAGRGTIGSTEDWRPETGLGLVSGAGLRTDWGVLEAGHSEAERYSRPLPSCCVAKKHQQNTLTFYQQ